MDFLETVISALGNDPIEVTAALFGFVCVVLTIRENIWCWPTGLVQVTLYVGVFYKAKLYSDMGLHVIYILMSVYGWYHWLYGGRGRTEARVTVLSGTARALWTLAAGAGTFALGWVMKTHTDAALPYWDAATTVLSLAAQWLMAKKILESWIFWITVDVLAVGVYYAKALYPTMILYAVFLVLATTGLFSWMSSWKHPEKSPQPA